MYYRGRKRAAQLKAVRAHLVSEYLIGIIMRKRAYYWIIGLLCIIIVGLVCLLFDASQSAKENFYVNSNCGFSLLYPKDWYPVDGWGDNISFVNDETDSEILFGKIGLIREWSGEPLSVEGLEFWVKYNLGIHPPYKQEMQSIVFKNNKFIFGVYDTTENDNFPNTIAEFINNHCFFIVLGYSGSLDANEFENLFEEFLRSMYFDDLLTQ